MSFMKQLVALSLTLLMALSLAACGKKTAGEPADEPGKTIGNIAGSDDAPDDPNALADASFVDYATLEEAVQAAGFKLSVPDALDGYNERTIQVMNDELIQVVYQNGGRCVRVRKIEGDADISGDDTNDKLERIEVMNDLSVTLKGDDSLIKTAAWKNKGFSYAVIADAGLSPEAMRALVTAVK